jgi:hypothetical protein
MPYADVVAPMRARREYAQNARDIHTRAVCLRTAMPYKRTMASADALLPARAAAMTARCLRAMPPSLIFRFADTPRLLIQIRRRYRHPPIFTPLFRLSRPIDYDID